LRGNNDLPATLSSSSFVVVFVVVDIIDNFNFFFLFIDSDANQYFNLYRFVHFQFGSARLSHRRCARDCLVFGERRRFADRIHHACNASATDATVMVYESFLAEVRSDKQLVPLKVQTRELQTVQFVTNGKGSHLLLAVARTYVHLYQIYHRTVRPGDAKITAQPALRQIVARSPLWFAWDVRNAMLAFVVAQPKATARKKEPTASCVLQLVYFTERARNASYPLDLDFQVTIAPRRHEPSPTPLAEPSEPTVLSLVHLPDHGLCLCAQRHEPASASAGGAPPRLLVTLYVLHHRYRYTCRWCCRRRRRASTPASAAAMSRAARSRSASRRAPCSLTACCRWLSLRR
jgi:hypothetical protein